MIVKCVTEHKHHKATENKRKFVMRLQFFQCVVEYAGD